MLYFIFSLLLTANIALYAAYEAVVLVPIADVLNQCVVGDSLYDVQQYYKNLPISWGPHAADRAVCPRLHQVLFNERVRVLEERNFQVKVELYNVWSYNPDNQLVHVTGWVLKDSILPLDVIAQYYLGYTIPDSFMTAPDQKPNTRDIITLKKPYYEHKTGLWLSAGTRFCRAIPDSFDHYGVWILHGPPLQAHIITIPKSYAVVDYAKNINHRIASFVSLLKTWATMRVGVPFVWGGCSIRALANKPATFYLEHRTEQGKTLYFWVCPGLTSVYSGFDVSGLILRTAQIWSIPYGCKNTTTAQRMISSLPYNKLIGQGNIISIPGGLLVVSDLDQNQIITTLGYQHNYGQLVQISLSDLFYNINTYDDLYHAYQQQKPLIMKDANGNVGKTITEWTILDLASTFK